ncbi:peptide chain release factor 1 [Mahella sp.]|uniref:peptide chain release factor 1 n=1 Tax=Mahella sp. TaxID=2798721 RepID=UPI0025BB09C1|nr:peptide chain release factor 1 [Mahella sp.]MBZ4665125.1 bacterial peptide chain release factor 1 (bRF) [Mahella sp.]
MLDRLDNIEERYEQLSVKMSDPEVISQQDVWRKLVKEHSDLEPIVTKYREYKEVVRQRDDVLAMIKETSDAELKELAQQEMDELKERQDKLEEELKRLLLPRDPNDDRNVIMEIRAGAGGEEAALFAANLFRMYSLYAESRGWKIEVMDSNYTDLGGIKEIVFAVEGKGAYSRLKYESGVHRVQRVPVTEAGGRIHTSTATVAVLPEAEEVEVEINPNDLRIDVYRSTGHGGQSVNTTDSAVRITHIPTGIVVTCQDEKSQLKNKDKAMRVLKSRLLAIAQAEQDAQLAQTRRSQVGTGDRSERIRTYNFPQGRVTDHRIGLTIYQLEAFLNGDMDEMIDALITADQAERLSQAAV